MNKILGPAFDQILFSNFFRNQSQKCGQKEAKKGTERTKIGPGVDKSRNFVNKKKSKMGQGQKQGKMVTINGQKVVK